MITLIGSLDIKKNLSLIIKLTSMAKIQIIHRLPE